MWNKFSEVTTLFWFYIKFCDIISRQLVEIWLWHCDFTKFELHLTSIWYIDARYRDVTNIATFVLVAFWQAFILGSFDKHFWSFFYEHFDRCFFYFLYNFLNVWIIVDNCWYFLAFLISVLIVLTSLLLLSY